MLRKLTEEYEGWRLEVNMDKTQYLVIGREGRDLNINGNVIKNVDEYNYLGCTITSDGRDEKDIMNKVTKGKSIVSQLNSILWNLNIRKDIKRRIYESIIESTVTYGAEVWTITQKLKKRIETVENSYWRRCCRLTLEDRIPYFPRDPIFIHSSHVTISL
uniref:Reverse transcriptase domain-containing protein n=1 Tax=Homalodisca liturata TaxID=320908 RepID=A0A1B6I2T3_9HEMI